VLLSQNEELIVSSQGWIDHSALWSLDTRSGKVSTQQLSDAGYLSTYQGSEGYFSVAHHYNGDRLEITVHSFLDPFRSVAAAHVGPAGVGFDDDPSAWAHVPSAYVEFLKRPSGSDCYLVRLDGARSRGEIIPLDWYDDSYDKGYQGVLDAVQVPGEDTVIISVQRDSHPVVFDPVKRAVRAKISLAGRNGNPTLRFRQRANELWADDYDTLLRLSPSSLKVKDRLRLQSAAAGTGQFIGEWCFDPAETLCAVARPFSGDVVGVDTKKFKVTHTSRLGGQPLLVALLTDGRVYARDWQTGGLLRGQLGR
jgi:hypothetical protein